MFHWQNVAAAFLSFTCHFDLHNEWLQISNSRFKHGKYCPSVLFSPFFMEHQNCGDILKVIIIAMSMLRLICVEIVFRKVPLFKYQNARLLKLSQCCNRISKFCSYSFILPNTSNKIITYWILNNFIKPLEQIC